MVLGQVNSATPYTFTTFAGSTGHGFADGTGSAARFAIPGLNAVDSAGNVYVADAGNNTIRQVTPAGVVTTLAGRAGDYGTNDGTGSAARFDNPFGVAVDSVGNLYVADSGNNTIRKVTPVGTNWVVTTLAGMPGVYGSVNGTGSAARFNDPIGLAVDTNGNVYVTDEGNNTIRKVTPTGVVTKIAGGVGAAGFVDGTGTDAEFNGPYGVAMDRAGNLYVGDANNNAIRKLTFDGTNWTVVTPAGLGTTGTNDGVGSDARFNAPRGVAVDSATNVYVADSGNDTIRKVTRVGTTWLVTTLAGEAGVVGSTDGTGSNALFSAFPCGVAVDSATNVYVADSANNTIRKMNLVESNWEVTTLAGMPPGSGQFANPYAVAMDSANNLYVADHNAIRQVTPAGVVTTLAGQMSAGTNDGPGTVARFNRVEGLAVDINGNIFVADSGNYTIRKVTPVGTNWVVTTLAGKTGVTGFVDGTGTNAEFGYPIGMALDSSGNVYVADIPNENIRKIAPVVTPLGTNWEVTTVAHVGGSTDVVADTNGFLYVAGYYGDAILRIAPTGVTTVLVGGLAGTNDGIGAAGRFNAPWGIAIDSATNLYVTDSGNNTIRKVTQVGKAWAVTTLAGSAASWGWADGTGNAARFYNPYDVALDSAGNIYVIDNGNGTIRKGFPGSSVPPPILQSPSLSDGQLGFGITGLTNLAVDIESSADLSNWQVVSTLILEGGSNFFVAPNRSLDSQFYRSHVR